MSDVTLRLAVVSADPQFRTTIAEMLRAHSEMAEVVVDLTMPASSLTTEAIDRIQAENPVVVLADLASDPAGGIRLMRLIGDAAPARTLLATGPTLVPDLLLEAMKAGVTEYLPAPVDVHDLADALRRAARRLGRAGGYTPAAAGRVVAFTGAKGGTGVTTAAANAALYAHKPDQRTLLLDLNLEGGSLAVALGLKARYSIVDLLESFHRVDESLLSSIVVKHDSGVHLLAAPLLPEAIPAVSGEQIRAVIRLLRRQYDLIVIDLGRPYSEYGRVVIDSADDVVLMLVPDVLAVHGAKRLLPLIRKGIESRNGHLAIVLNRLDAADEVQQKDVEEALDAKVTTLRRDDAAVSSSLNLGKPVALNGGRSKYARYMKALSVRILGEGHEAEPTGVSRLLRIGRRSAQ
jgi:pilus assembly protein CpaE